MKIFVASTGRCGTMYMAEVFKALTDIPTFHEPEPFGNDIIRAVNSVDERKPATVRRIVKEKVDKIEKWGDYCETSSMFIKVWVDKFLDAFYKDVYCIYLDRNVMDYFASYIQHTEAYTSGHMGSLLHSCWSNNVLKMPESLNWYNTILWNYYEVKARYSLWKFSFKKTYCFDFEQINNRSEYHRMFDYFGIPFDRSVPLPDKGKNSLEDRGIHRVPLQEILKRVRWDLPCNDFGQWIK